MRISLTVAAMALAVAVTACGGDPTQSSEQDAQSSEQDNSNSEGAGTGVSAKMVALGGVQVAPQDGCGSLPGFADYREDLLDAVEDRDFEELVPLLDPAIRLDFGGNGGLEDFQDNWASSPETASDFWAAMDEITGLGCASQDGMAAMPYYFWNLPDSVDSYSSFIPVRSPVVLRESGSEDGAVVGALQWNVLTVDPGSFDPDAAWLNVKTGDGTSGWVAQSDVRSTLDYRVIFNRVDGKWKMTAFIAGD